MGEEQATLSPAPPHVVLLASPGAGHLIPLSELARRLVVRHGFEATLLTFSNLFSPTHSSALSSLPAAVSTVSLPAVDISDVPPTARPETLMMTIPPRSIPHVRSFLASLKHTTGRLAAFVPDIFCAATLRVATELSVPAYLFFPTNLMSLTTMLHLPELDAAVSGEFHDLADPVRLPGCLPLHGADLFEPLQDRKNPVYAHIIELGKQYPDADGFLVNSFEEMEPATMKALKDQDKWPPAYPVGPFVRPGSDEQDKPGCLSWLDRQPAGSVIFVSFGSGGTLSTVQTAELAHGLEMSGQRFLWVVHLPSDKEANAAFFGLADDHADDPLSYLPQGFLDRTKDVGIAVASWAPQVRVLAHPATGGFLSHCGWNSTLESMSSAVPMIAWPLYAEQRMNAVMLADSAGLALRPRVREDGVVAREEIAKVAKELMVGEKGKAARRRAKEMQEAAARAVAPEGSSYKALEVVANKWKGALGMENGSRR